MKVGLWKIAHARSGDKADRADIGLFAYDAPTYAVLKREVTRERLAAHFADICKGSVEIYPLDNLLAMKIVLNAALQAIEFTLPSLAQRWSALLDTAQPSRAGDAFPAGAKLQATSRSVLIFASTA